MKWWTCGVWMPRYGVGGIKVGPLAVACYQWDGWQFVAAWMNTYTIDTGMRAHGGTLWNKFR